MSKKDVSVKIMDKRKIFIGDVHGCLDELKLLLKKVKFKEGRDTLYFVGDLINKGPDSKGVLDYVMKLPCHCILGNHEHAFIEFLEKGQHKKYEVFNRLKKELGSNLANYLKFLKSCPLYISEDDFTLVHAGLSPRYLDDLSKESARVLTYIRTWNGSELDINNQDDSPWYELYNRSKLVIYGHWASRGLTIRENTIGLDSGCVYGQQLSALILPSREIIQVDAIDTYCPI